MSKKFSDEFKAQAVKKVLQRTQDQSVRLLAKELNVGFSTLTAWTAEYRAKSAIIGQAKRPNDWSKAERFAALMTSSLLQDNELNHFCRHAGIFQHHLDSWKNEFINGTEGQMKKTDEKN